MGLWWDEGGLLVIGRNGQGRTKGEGCCSLWLDWELRGCCWRFGCLGGVFGDIPRGLAVVTLVGFDYTAFFDVLLGIQYSI